MFKDARAGRGAVFIHSPTIARKNGHSNEKLLAGAMKGELIADGRWTARSVKRFMRGEAVPFAGRLDFVP